MSLQMLEVCRDSAVDIMLFDNLNGYIRAAPKHFSTTHKAANTRLGEYSLGVSASFVDMHLAVKEKSGVVDGAKSS